LHHSPHPKNASQGLAFFDLPAGEVGFGRATEIGRLVVHITISVDIALRICETDLHPNEHRQMAHPARGKKKIFPQKFPQ
jgi:hypothetical protein